MTGSHLRSAAGRIHPGIRDRLRRGLHRLPPPRDAAALAVARAVLDLVAGRAPDWRKRAKGGLPLTSRELLSNAHRLYADGRFEEAVAAATAVLASDPAALGAHDLLHQANQRAGEITAGLVAVRAMRRVADSPVRAALDRRLVGSLRESDPRWLPRIPGPPRPIEPAAPNRILHLLKVSIPDRQSGYTMRSHYNMRAELAAGLDPVGVTALGFPRSAGRAPEGVETIDGMRFHRLDLGPAYPTDRPVDQYLADYAWAAGQVVTAERPALLHASSGRRGYEIALVGLALRERFRLPLIYEVRGFFEATWSRRESAEKAEIGRRRMAAEIRVMRAADAVITIAEAMREDIIARGIPAQKVFVVPNGVDGERFAPLPASAELRSRHRLRGFVFGYISNLDHPRENQELLIEAVTKLRARGRDVTCLIVGDGARRRDLEDRAKAAPAGDAVVFTGQVPHAQITDYYALMDAFVVPRRDERAARYVTPLKPYEAMAMRRPLVVADLPALSEIAAPDERGLSFPPGDVDGLVACLERLMDDPALASRIADAGHDWVLRERSWAANVPRFEEAYAYARAAWASGS